MLQKIKFVLSRLWHYQSVYFLKPNDAVNDTLTSSLLHELDWSGQIIEIGSGDGVFSYIMDGGNFPIWFDRYILTDFNKQDIYDTHQKTILKSGKKIDIPVICLSIDAKKTHVEKVKEINFAKNAIQAPYEALPLESESVEKVFYYTPHGLIDHDSSLKEVRRILKPGGKLLILLYHKCIENSFLCHSFSKRLPGRLSLYFKKLDNGRFSELTKLAKSFEDWEDLFEGQGFKINKRLSGLSRFAWKVYDIQTRPILKNLIYFFNFLPKSVRTLFKVLWMVVFFPYIVIFYFLFSNQFIKFDKHDCYVVYELEKCKNYEQAKSNTTKVV